MITDCRDPYQRMLTVAAVLTQPPSELSHRHLRALAGELAATVRDLDTRLRAGLVPPTAWTHIQGQALPETGPGRSSITHRNNSAGRT